jgi:hypothetical protein
LPSHAKPDAAAPEANARTCRASGALDLFTDGERSEEMTTRLFA